MNKNIDRYRIDIAINVFICVHVCLCTRVHIYSHEHTQTYTFPICLLKGPRSNGARRGMSTLSTSYWFLNIISTKGSLGKWLILPLGLRKFKMTLDHLVQENKEVLTEWWGCVKRTRSQIVRAPISQMWNIKIK